MHRLLATLATAIGLAPAASTAATPPSVSSQAAPAAWVAYAGLVNQAVTGQLGGTHPAAVRLRDYLNQVPGSTTESRLQFPIKVWIDGQGVITKVDFPPFAHPEPNADLQVLLVGHRLSQAPPKVSFKVVFLDLSESPLLAPVGHRPDLSGHRASRDGSFACLSPERGVGGAPA